MNEFTPLMKKFGGRTLAITNEKSMSIGRLWWCADNLKEARQWQSKYLSKGALAVELKPENDRSVVDVLITLDMSTASNLVGYEIEPEEWMAE